MKIIHNFKKFQKEKNENSLEFYDEIKNIKPFLKGNFYIKFFNGFIFDSVEEKNRFEKSISIAHLLLYTKKFMPQIFEVIKDWKVINKSPYSMSFYNSDEIGWDYKPVGSLRISDHWNFKTGNKLHCKIKGYNGGETIYKLLLCRFNNDGEYEIIKEIA